VDSDRGQPGGVEDLHRLGDGNGDGVPGDLDGALSAGAGQVPLGVGRSQGRAEDKVPGLPVGGQVDALRADAGLGQARSYVFWLKPAYYVITGSDYLTVWNYQGGAVPDLRVCEARRATLHEQFGDLYAVLNPEAALATRQQKISRLSGGTSARLTTPQRHQDENVLDERPSHGMRTPRR
jgi:hypothetical protein